MQWLKRKLKLKYCIFQYKIGSLKHPCVARFYYYYYILPWFDGDEIKDCEDVKLKDEYEEEYDKFFIKFMIGFLLICLLIGILIITKVFEK